MKQSSFRDAMTTLASGVSVLTTNGSEGTYGITITSLTSVTDTPPTLLACINRNGIANQIFKANKKVCINILNASQAAIGQQYASKSEQQKLFDNLQWYIQQDLPPELKEAASILQGTVSSVVEYGTHSVFFIQIDTIKSSHNTDALVYFHRQFIKIRG